MAGRESIQRKRSATPLKCSHSKDNDRSFGFGTLCSENSRRPVHSAPKALAEPCAARGRFAGRVKRSDTIPPSSPADYDNFVVGEDSGFAGILFSAASS